VCVDVFGLLTGVVGCDEVGAIVFVVIGPLLPVSLTCPFGSRSAMIATTSTTAPNRTTVIPATRSRRRRRASWRASRPVDAFSA
jgi:hypothetical protein